jgi:hypothetical protein
VSESGRLGGLFHDRGRNGRYRDCVSVIISFSNGESWRTASRGWDELIALTRVVLAERDLQHLVSELYPYGLSFDSFPDEVQLPLAAAMLAAARKWWEAEMAAGNDGDHCRQLVDLLEIEAAAIQRAPFVKFAGTKWSTTLADWDRIAARTREVLTAGGQGHLVREVLLPGVSFSGTDGDNLARAMLAVVRELADGDLAAGRDPAHLRELAGLLAQHVAYADRPPGIRFTSNATWVTNAADWERLTGRARARLAEQGLGHGTIYGRGILLRGVQGRMVIETAEALLASARELAAEDRTRGEDPGHLTELVSLLDAEVADRRR